MAKLSEIVFSPSVRQEFDIAGHKVVFRALTTRDNIDMNLNMEDKENYTVAESLEMTVALLTQALVSVDGAESESKEESRTFLLNLSPAHLTEFFTAYQTFSGGGTDLEKK